MSRLNQNAKLWNGAMRAVFNPASLQFRLMAGVVGICAIALLSYKAISHWEVQTLLMMQPDHLTSTQFTAIADRLTTIGLLAMSLMMLAVLGIIWQSLQSLHQLNQWVIATATDNEAEPFKARRAPLEIRVLAHHWNAMLSQQAAVKHQQRQFINNVAHELRSPLSLVQGYLQRTSKRSQTLPESQQESLAMAAAEAER